MANTTTQKKGLISTLVGLHNTVFGALERATATWLPSTLARFLFAAILFVYYWNSAGTKVGDGLAGFFQIQAGAYFQIVPPIVEAAGYNPADVAFFPWKIIVFAGTYMEFLLPILIVIGLFTRLAAIGMIGFVVVQSYVDIVFHSLDEKSIGGWFDRFPDSIIYDQRALWLFPLVLLVIKGAGVLSVDAILGRFWAGREATPGDAAVLSQG